MNNNINIQKSKVDQITTQLMDNIQKMQNILNTLSENVNTMTWSGSNAERFKTAINKQKEELNIIYSEYIVKIPEKIEQSISNYQKYEG